MGILDGLGQRFEAMYDASDDALKRLVPSASDTALNNACVRIHSLLIRNATIAVSRIGEIGNYPPLREHFLNNVRNENHVEVIGDTIRIWNTDIAGTHADLIAGWIRRGTDAPHDRLIRWMYGIYIPGRMINGDEGAIEKYEGTIAERLAIWGEKAPYWYFINYGNEGYGAYPHFKGEFFVEKTIPFIARALREEMKGAEDAVTRGITTQIRKSYRDKIVSLESIPSIYPEGGPPEGYRAIYKTKNGKIMWYNMITHRIAKWTQGVPGE